MHWSNLIADRISFTPTDGDAKCYQFDCFYENGPDDIIFVSFKDGVALIDDMVNVRMALLRSLSLLRNIFSSQ